MGRHSFLPFILLFIFLIGLGKEGSCTAVRHSVNGCSAWRTSIESGNARGWKVVPSRCVSNIGKYMERGQYSLDFKVAIEQSLAYVNDLELHGDDKDAWVFDIDETTLSNLPYNKNYQYGGEKDQGSTVVEYKPGKRDELVKNGYRILGNVGYQWSDLTGSSVGSRTFKLPNPMYYIS